MTASMDPTTTTTTTATTASHLLLSSRLLAHWSQYLLTYLSTVLIFKRNTSGSGRKAFDGICIYFRLLRHDQNKQKKHKSFVDVLKAIEDANHQAIITFICKIYSLQHLESVEAPARQDRSPSNETCEQFDSLLATVVVVQIYKLCNRTISEILCFKFKVISSLRKDCIYQLYPTAKRCSFSLKVIDVTNLGKQDVVSQVTE